jgi:hypothetical protein
LAGEPPPDEGTEIIDGTEILDAIELMGALARRQVTETQEAFATRNVALVGDPAQRRERRAGAVILRTRWSSTHHLSSLAPVRRADQAALKHLPGSQLRAGVSTTRVRNPTSLR